MTAKDLVARLNEYFNWERLRRLVREPILDRSGVALFSLLGGLLLIAGRGGGNPSIAPIDSAYLAGAMAGFPVFFLSWLPSYVAIAVLAPRIYIDYENQEKFVDASLRTHSQEALQAENFRANYVEAWQLYRSRRSAARIVIAGLITVSLTAYAISLALAVRALLPFGAALL